MTSASMTALQCKHHERNLAVRENLRMEKEAHHEKLMILRSKMLVKQAQKAANRAARAVEEPVVSEG